MKTLLPRRWLNDEIINFYRALIQVQCNNQNRSVWSFRTNFYSTLTSKGYKDVKRWTRRVESTIFEKELIIIPINVGSTHWCCGVINFTANLFEVYDSSKILKADEFGENMLDYLKEEHFDKKKVKFDTDGWESVECDCPLQNNGVDCGVFTSQFMRCLAFNKRVDGHAQFDFDQSKIPYLREQMISDIRNKEILGKAVELQ